MTTETAPKRVAILGDSLSKEFYFSAWMTYYATLFGQENIHIVSYKGADLTAADVGRAKLVMLEAEYGDDLRLAAVEKLCGELLKTYDYVIRVDTDEFVVADPQHYASLRDYIEKCDVDSVTGYGFDVIQFPTEAPLDLSKPLLAQRKYAFALTALNKTCLTRVPLKWSRGFHHSSSQPHFAGLYILHAKRLDIEFQKVWNRAMCEKAPNDPFIAHYYGAQIVHIDNFHAHRAALPTCQGDDVMVRTDFNARFEQGVHVNEAGLYDGPYVIEEVNVELPQRFRGFF